MGSIYTDITILDVLNTWFKWSKFDPNQKSFNILSNSYDIHKATELALKVLNDIDNTGVLSVLLLKERYNKILKDTRVKLYDIISKPKNIQAEVEMYRYFNADVVREAEKSLQYTLGKLYENVVGTSLIADKDKEFNLVNSLEDILNDIEKLSIDIYKTDGKPIKMEKYSQNIKVFNTLGEAVLTLENSVDGIYTCYINVLNSADSYFGIFIKSGGTLISFNDRINEVYPGQHEVLSTRNGRWSDNKRDSLFPYDFVLEYDKHCHKGYAMSYKIKGESTSKNVLFKDFSDTTGFFGLILGLLILKMKYNGKTFDGELTCIESLIGERLKLVTGANELMVLQDSSIVEFNKNINLTFTDNEIHNGIDGYSISDYAKSLTNLYGDDFIPNYDTIMNPENTKLLIECGEVSPYHVRPEFVGNSERLRAGAYHLLRKQLKDHISNKINEEFKEFGGKDACYKWLKSTLNDNLDTIILKLAYEYRKAEEKAKSYKDADEAWKEGIRLNLLNDNMQIIVSHTPYPPYGGMSTSLPARMILNESIQDSSGKFKCILGDNVCSVFFTVTFRTIGALETFLCTKVNAPKFLSIDDDLSYKGNSLLDMIDPVKFISNPINYRNDSVTLVFAVGFSKRNLNKVLKITK